MEILLGRYYQAKLMYISYTSLRTVIFQLHLAHYFIRLYERVRLEKRGAASALSMVQVSAF